MKYQKVFDKANEVDAAVGRVGGEGVGTDDRRLARLFDSFNMESFASVAFGNYNNVNQTDAPGSDGGFGGNTLPRSVNETKQFGLSRQFEKDRGNVSNEFSLYGSWNDNDADMMWSEKSYLPQESVFGKTINQSLARTMNKNGMNRLQIRVPFYMPFDTKMSYDRNHTNSSVRNATLNHNPQDFDSMDELHV